MDFFTELLLVLVIVLYLPWIALIVIFPWQAMYCLYRKKRKEGKKSFYLKFLAIPYFFFDEILMRGGWLRYSILRMSIFPSCHIRKLFYKGLSADVSKYVVFHYRTEIRSPFTLHVGSGSIIGDNALLDARNGLFIGQNVNLSSNVSIYTEQHNHRDPLFRCNQSNRKEVIIGDRVWLGSNVTILPGVHIGEGAVCCAGCVVTKDIEPYTVVAGIPAHRVGERPKDLQYEFKGRSCRLF